MRAAGAAPRGLCQERFRAALDDPGTFGMSNRYYQVCLKCLKCSIGYLGCWGFVDAAA